MEKNRSSLRRYHCWLVVATQSNRSSKDSLCADIPTRITAPAKHLRGAIDESSIGIHRDGDVFGLLLPSLDLHTFDADVRQVGQDVVRGQVAR